MAAPYWGPSDPFVVDVKTGLTQGSEYQVPLQQTLEGVSGYAIIGYMLRAAVTIQNNNAGVQSLTDARLIYNILARCIWDGPSSWTAVGQSNPTGADLALWAIRAMVQFGSDQNEHPTYVNIAGGGGTMTREHTWYVPAAMPSGADPDAAVDYALACGDTFEKFATTWTAGGAAGFNNADLVIPANGITLRTFALLTPANKGVHVGVPYIIRRDATVTNGMYVSNPGIHYLNYIDFDAAQAITNTILLTRVAQDTPRTFAQLRYIDLIRSNKYAGSAARAGHEEDTGDLAATARIVPLNTPRFGGRQSGRPTSSIRHELQTNADRSVVNVYTPETMGRAIGASVLDRAGQIAVNERRKQPVTFVPSLVGPGSNMRNVTAKVAYTGLTRENLVGQAERKAASDSVFASAANALRISRGEAT